MKAISILCVMVAVAAGNYSEVVQRVAEMTWDNSLARTLDRYGLNVVNVTWEDTGRYSGSVWGPNISDLTIQVQHGKAGRMECTPMPVIRYPNFHDLSADLDPDNFYLLTGNERGEELTPVNLTDYVWNLRNHLSDPDSWPGRSRGLWAARDSVVLVSAQAVFLPIPSEGEAIFNPVLYNYQSYPGDPAVLAIVATREGTSATIIDNSSDYTPAGWYGWGQQLFYNSDGQRASFTGTRLSDFIASGGDTDGSSVAVSGQEGLNMVLLIQIPLRQKERRDLWFECAEEMAAPSMDMSASGGYRSNVEAAVVGHGELEGPYREIDGNTMVRDDRFPIRVTVQFYKATDNGVASEEDIRQIAEQITRVYEDASYVGSLVVPDEKIVRPTDWNRDDVEVSLRKRLPWIW